MQFDVPDGVTKATSAPRSVVSPSRSAVWNGAGSTGVPASTQLTTPAIGVSGAGAAAEVLVGGRDVDGLAEAVLDGTGDARSGGADCPPPDEHPATSNDAAKNRAIRIPPR